MAKYDKRADAAIIAALLCGATEEAAGAKAGVSARTVRRRLRIPAFVRKLRKRRAEMDVRSADQLTAARTEAIRTLLQLLQPANSASARLGAARAVLEASVKLRESADLHVRLTELEQRLDQQVNDKRRG
jgi:seryl-tRNA synthetase